MDDAFKAVAKTAGATRVFCFAPDTLISTNQGLRRIGDVNTGDLVHAYNFQAGRWELSEVLHRHDNRYDGEIVKVHIGDTTIEATVNHPFWVIEGARLRDRSRPEHLDVGEDEGFSIPGRWINSQDLRPQDAVFCQDGKARRVTRVEMRSVQDGRVCNLTIRDQHTFAVGADAVLVHNTGWCDILAKDAGIPIPQALKNKIKELGLKESQIHGHHIVQKITPSQYQSVKHLSVQEIAGRSTSQQSAWYIGKSQEILAKWNIPLLDDFAATQALARAGQPLHNLTWAINGNGTHSLGTHKAVWEALFKATSQEKAITELARMGERLSNGKRLF